LRPELKESYKLKKISKINLKMKDIELLLQITHALCKKQGITDLSTKKLTRHDDGNSFWHLIYMEYSKKKNCSYYEALGIYNWYKMNLQQFRDRLDSLLYVPAEINDELVTDSDVYSNDLVKLGRIELEKKKTLEDAHNQEINIIIDQDKWNYLIEHCIGGDYVTEKFLFNGKFSNLLTELLQLRGLITILSFNFTYIQFNLPIKF
jgi:hypothetical protein